jgi:hypothetical protein
MPHVRRTTAVIASLAAALLLPASVSAVPSPAATPTLDVGYGECWADVENLAPKAKVTGILRNKQGSLKGQDTDRATVNGDADLCFPRPIVGGDTITLRVGGTVIRRFTIPTLGVRPDRDTDVVTLRGTPGSTFNVERADCTVAGLACAAWETREFTMPPSGTDAWDLDGIQDITGGDRFYLEWVSPKGDVVSIYTAAPHLQVFIGRSRAFGNANPGTAVTVRLRRGGTLVGQGSATADAGYDYATTLRKNGSPVTVRQGDIVRGSFASDAVLPATLTMEIDGDGIVGACLPEVDVRLALRSGDGESYEYAASDEVGAYAFTGLGLDARVGQTAIVLCTSDAGDTVGRSLVIPAP